MFRVMKHHDVKFCLRHSLQYHLKSVHGIKVVVAEYRQMKYRDPMLGNALSGRLKYWEQIVDMASNHGFMKWRVTFYRY